MLGWLSEPHGYGLNDDAGIDDRVRPAEDGNQPIEIGAAAEHLEESPLPVEAVVAAGEAARRQLRGDDAVFRSRARRGAACSSIRSSRGCRSTGSRRSSACGAAAPSSASSAWPRPRRRRTCRSCRCCGSRACSGRDRSPRRSCTRPRSRRETPRGTPRPDARVRSATASAAASAGHRRMRQQPERPIRRRRELRVVVVHRVAARGVDERGVRGRRQSRRRRSRSLLSGRRRSGRSRARSRCP